MVCGQGHQHDAELEPGIVSVDGGMIDRDSGIPSNGYPVHSSSRVWRSESADLMMMRVGDQSDNDSLLGEFAAIEHKICRAVHPIRLSIPPTGVKGIPSIYN